MAHFSELLNDHSLLLEVIFIFFFEVVQTNFTSPQTDGTDFGKRENKLFDKMVKVQMRTVVPVIQ